MKRSSWTRWIPGLQTLREYELSWLRSDIVAGIVLSTMLVPVGIAYAVASGVPAIYGLYATVVPLIVYALFGPSRILVLGPDSSLAPIILGVVLPLSMGDPMRAVALAGGMAIVSGLVCILAGVGTAGVPAGSLPVIAMILAMVGVPAEGIGLILGVDRFLDMCRTTLNVTGDLVIATVVSRGETDPVTTPADEPVAPVSPA